jgi:hypothetical protein
MAKRVGGHIVYRQSTVGINVREPLKNYLARPGGVEFAKKMLIYYV